MQNLSLIITYHIITLFVEYGKDERRERIISLGRKAYTGCLLTSLPVVSKITEMLNTGEDGWRNVLNLLKC